MPTASPGLVTPLPYSRLIANPAPVGLLAKTLPLMAVPPPGAVLPTSTPHPRAEPAIDGPPRNTLFRTDPETPPALTGDPFTSPKLIPIGSFRKTLFSIFPPDRACRPWLAA